ncbi:MAG TPA: deoxyribonuclease IV [Gemmatimonadales bacterium]|nr:deoxyribonuclease IV [Gemmatimonadales bacterium]
MHRSATPERLGAHVSIQGGVDTAPARGLAIGATAIQVFTKTPNQWREPTLGAGICAAFRRAVEESGLRAVISHDSYLINLASPDPRLSARSVAAFMAELRRCRALGIRHVVSHPGNYIDDRDLGLRRNAAAYARCLRAVPGGPMVLLETTAGTGTALGSTFEELARLRALIPPALRRRIGFCADTCHLYSAGYDLVGDFDAVWARWDRVLGRGSLRALHLNDSKTPFGSRRDRHELIGEGSLGPEPFRRLMTDPRFARVIKILETPKGDHPTAMDRKMLRRLRGYARAPGRASVASAPRRADL